MKRKIKLLFVKSYAYAPNQSFDVPLGVLYLSGYLKKYLGDNVIISFVDLRIKKNRQEVLRQKLAGFRPDIIGINTLAFEHEFLDANIALMRKEAPSSLIVIGGPYATSNYDRVLRENDIDIVVRGEGERILVNLVKAYANNEDLKQIKGLTYLDEKGKILCTGKEPYIEDLDTIPFPDYSLINFKDYWKGRLQFNGILAEKKHVTIMSSRACPYNCIYCHNIFGSKFRARSPENFVDEIKFLYTRYNVREFHIIDDVFNLDRARMRKILNLIIESKMRLKLAFPNGLRGDIIERKDIDLLKRAGTYMVGFAIETGSDRMQKLIKKNANIAKIIENIEYSHDVGLIARGAFMLGFPGESIDEIRQTIRLAASIRMDMVTFAIVVPYKNTELYDIAKTYLPNMDTDFLSSYISSELFYNKSTGYDVRKLQKYGYMRFYNPMRLITLFIKIPRKFYQLKTWIVYSYKLLTA